MANQHGGAPDRRARAVGVNGELWKSTYPADAYAKPGESAKRPERKKK